MTITAKPGTWPLPRERKTDGRLHHVVCQGSREHVLWWDSLGTHCSEAECEVNAEAEEKA